MKHMKPPSKAFLFFTSVILGICITSSAARAEKAVESFLNSENRYQSVKVAKVISADTFVLESGEKIQLIGLKAPDKPPKKKVDFDQYGIPIKVDDPKITIEERAYNFTKEMLEGKSIRLEFDYDKKSPNYATLAYAFLSDKTFVNAEVLRQGYALLNIVPPNRAYVDVLQQAYQEARREQRGLHGE